ncbi:MAG TPA: Rrf2 family transcriptional regulator [Jiangellaceae bacterium]|nr:Rrf2 family transcriptional regulator [Jiangellaceae bacterium]
MSLSEGVEWSLHCAWLLTHVRPGEALSSRRMAEFYGLPSAYLPKLLKSLVRAGILDATTGPRGGFRLARPAGDITVLDIMEAVEGRGPLFQCTEIRQRGPAPVSKADCRRPCGIAKVMHDAERAWRAQLAATTVADLANQASSGSDSRARRWLESLPERKGFELTGG